MSAARKTETGNALVLGLLVVAGGARAESIFGLNLLGERVDVGDARVSALGGFVQILDDSLGVLQYNPAALAWSKRVSFGVAGCFTSDVNKSAELEQRVNGTKFTNFAFAFPVFRNRVTAGFGFRGRYDPDGTFTLPKVTSEGEDYSEIYERSGGLFAVPLTLAVDAGNYAKIGVFYSIERGTIEDRWTTDFPGSGADATSLQERTFTGHALGAGFMTRPTPRLSVGLTYESQIDYDVDVKQTFTNTTADTSFAESATLPARMTASVTFRAARGFVIYLGGSVCDFTRFEGINFPSERLVKEEIAALGLEYKFSSGLPLRAAFHYEQLPYTMPNGEQIKKMGFTFGSGILMKRGRGKVDAALQFATTGSVDTNTYQDRSVRFYFSITGSEDWKRAREGRM
jgi:opacity protein-like surface antigen